MLISNKEELTIEDEGVAIEGYKIPALGTVPLHPPQVLQQEVSQR
jgi:hypothetical protein